MSNDPGIRAGGHLSPGEIDLLRINGLSPEAEEQVIRHLDDCSACRARLEDGDWGELQAAGVDAGRGAPPADYARGVPPALEALRPDYEDLEEIGRGGAGIVYRAREKTTQRLVAIKVLLPGAEANQELAPRLLSEARRLARLVHDHIVPLYTSFERAGSVFLVLEYCAGGTLADLLARGRLREQQVVDYLIPLARAVQHAHSRQIVHRDLKPGNVFFADVEHRVLMVGDFGLARDLADPARHTRSGVALGTPAYMAPEQAKGDKDVGPAADVWALGAVLYECLTGRPPFVGKTDYDIFRRIIEDEVERPRVPDGLAAICLKCLRKSPRDRYASAADLADDLARFQAGGSPCARLPGWRERGRRLGRRVARLDGVRQLLAALAWGWSRRGPAFVLALLVLVAVLGWPSLRPWVMRFLAPTPALTWPEVGTPYVVFDDEERDFQAGGWMPHGGEGLWTDPACPEAPKSGRVCYKAVCDLRQTPWRGDCWLLDGQWHHARPRVNLLEQIGARRGDRVVLRFWGRSPERATVNFKFGDRDHFAIETGWQTLTPEWQPYQLDLTGHDGAVSRVFLWVMDRQRNPASNPTGWTLYLDQIRVSRVEPPQ